MSERRTIGLAVAAALLLIMLGARRIASEHEIVRLGYELTSARVEQREVDEEARRLRLEYSVLVSPERIRRLATSLGMQPPSPDQIRIVNTGEGER